MSKTSHKSKSSFTTFIAPIAKAILPKKTVEKIKANARKKVAYDISKRIPFQRDKYPDGINFFGHLKTEIGHGEGGRLYGLALEQSPIPHLFIDVPLAKDIPHQNNFYDIRLSKEPQFNISVFHINPENMFYVESLFNQSILDYRYNIACFVTELNRVPQQWKQYLPFFDEFWVFSSFEKCLLEKETDKPITIISYGLPEIKLGNIKSPIPNDCFTFVSMFDGRSSMERKNIKGTIASFKKAFGNRPDVCLFIKTGRLDKSDRAELDALIGDAQNIIVYAKYISHDEVLAILKEADCFVSMHRAEGFGLVMAEAMFVKTVVLATNYSSATDFLKDDFAYLVPYEMVECTKSYQGESGFMWADPNIDEAARLMKLVMNDCGLRHQKSELAYAYACEHLTTYACTRSMMKRYRELGMMIE